MTASNTIKRVAYTGTNTVGQTMSITFDFYDSTDIIVIERITATGVESTKTLNTDYTIAGGSGTTGTLTTLVAVPTSKTWTLHRSIPQTQATDYIANEALSSSTLEQNFDKPAYRDQDAQEQIDRSLKYPVTDSTSLSSELPNSVDRASKYLGFDANSEPTALSAPTDTSTTTSLTATFLAQSTEGGARSTLDIDQGAIADLPAAGNSGTTYLATDELETLYDDGSNWLGIGNYAKHNLVTNGQFQVNQRKGPYDSTATYPNNDDAWTFDHVLLLSDGNAIVELSQRAVTQVPAGFVHGCRATVATANKKFGFLFPIEHKHCAPALGTTKSVSLSFWAQTTAANPLENIRAGVLSWAGTADAITSDVVSAWGAEGTNPTLATNWTFENTPSNLVLAQDSWTQYRIQNIAVDSSTVNNLAVFIWVDDTDAAAQDILDVTGVMLNVGPAAAPFEHKPFAIELVECQRYYRKSFDYATEPAQNTGDESGALTYRANTATASAAGAQVIFPSPMFGDPTVTFYGVGSASTVWWNLETTAQVSGASSTVSLGNNGFYAGNAQVANDAVGDSIAIHWDAVSEM